MTFNKRYLNLDRYFLYATYFAVKAAQDLRCGVELSNDALSALTNLDRISEKAIEDVIKQTSHLFLTHDAGLWVTDNKSRKILRLFFNTKNEDKTNLLKIDKLPDVVDVERFLKFQEITVKIEEKFVWNRNTDKQQPVGRNKRGFRTLRRMSLNAFGADFGTYGAMRKNHLLRPTGWANFDGVASSGGKCDSKVLKN